MMLSTYAQGPNGPDRRRDLSSKVLVLNQYFPPDTASTGRYVSTIASRLADEGFDVTAVVSQPSYGADLPLAPARESVDGVEVVRVGTGPWRGRQTLARRLGGYGRYLAGAWRASRGRTPDVVLAFHNPPLVGLLAALIARRSRARLILVVLDIHPDILVATRWIGLPTAIFRAWDSLNRVALRAASSVVVLGEGMRRTLIEDKGLAADAVRVIPPWSEPALTPSPPDETWRQEQGVDGDLLVLCAGNLGVMQPLEAVIEAMARLRGAGISLAVLGEGVRRAEWEARAAELGADRVRFLGYLPDDEFARAVSASDAALVSLAPGMELLSVPSRSFTFLSAGCPVIALMDPHADVAQFVGRHGCGWVVTSAEELAELLGGLGADRARCRRAGERAHLAYRRSYDPAALTGMYVELVSEASWSKIHP